jgi:hypothetical protein
MGGWRFSVFDFRSYWKQDLCWVEFGALLLLLFFLCFSILTDDWVLKFMRDEAMLLSFVVEPLKF